MRGYTPAVIYALRDAADDADADTLPRRYATLR